MSKQMREMADDMNTDDTALPPRPEDARPDGRAPLHTTLVGEPDASRRIVFLHGLFGRGRNFSRIAQGMLPEAQSLLIDLPNHGQSGWTDTLDYPDLADRIAEHLSSGFAASEPVDVVGHSMGGKVAMVLALRHPALVRRLAVLDISPVASGSARGEFTHLLESLAGLDLAGVTSRAEADAQLSGPIGHPTVRGFLLQNLQRDASGDGFRWQPNLALLRAELETIMGFPDVGGLTFDGPVLWIRGGRSDYVQDDDAPVMRALFPKTVRMTVRGAGHWLHSEEPDQIIAALRRFTLTE